MKIMIPSGHIDSSVLRGIDLILTANDLNRISRRDRLRGFIHIPEDVAADVVMDLQSLGIAAT